jgi:hypothetical protein
MIVSDRAWTADPEQPPCDIQDVALVCLELRLAEQVVGQLSNEGWERCNVEESGPGNGAHEVKRVRA